jgi:exosome complex component RRP41
VAVGKAGGMLALDLNKIEDNFGQSDMPIAISHRDRKLLLLQMDGLLTRDEVLQMLEMAERGCDSVHEVQANALKRFYEKGEEESVKW